MDEPTHAPISPEELTALRAELEMLRAQVATLTRQKAHYRADLERVLKSSFPLPPTEEEMREAGKNPNALAELIAELEAGRAGNEPGR
jgi:outer membrane protein TolC